LQAIHILFAFVSHEGIKLLDVDVKSAFLNGFLNKKVYIEQPPIFENPKFLNRAFKLYKALYILKQALRA